MDDIYLDKIEYLLNEAINMIKNKILIYKERI